MMADQAHSPGSPPQTSQNMDHIDPVQSRNTPAIVQIGPSGDAPNPADDKTANSSVLLQYTSTSMSAAQGSVVTQTFGASGDRLEPDSIMTKPVTPPSMRSEDTTLRAPVVHQPLRYSPLIPQTVMEQEAETEEEDKEEEVKEKSQMDKVNVNIDQSLKSLPPTQGGSDSETETIVKHFSEASQNSSVLGLKNNSDKAEVGGQKEQYESDMETVSDNESRLIVDSDTRTDDGNDELSSTEGEASSKNKIPYPEQLKDTAASATAQPVIVPASTRHFTQMTNVPFVMSRSISTSGLSQVQGSTHVAPELPKTIITKDSEITSNVINIIPSVVSDMDTGNDNSVQGILNGKRHHPSKAALKSLPANFPKMLETNTDSLFKLNKPKQVSPLPQVVRDAGESSLESKKSMPSNIEQLLRRHVSESDRSPLPNVIPTHVREMAEMQGPVPTRPEGLEHRNLVSRPQILNLPHTIMDPKDVKVETSQKELQVLMRQPDEIKLEKVTMSSPMLTAQDNYDLLKDPGSSEDQVNNILKKYNIFGPAAKREVSVKDMRRVIPQLIMCLFSKDDHHARKVKGLWEKKPTHWPDHVPYCDPNNSNRGGEGGGKPKKETLHKMFGFLLDKYLQKMCKEGSYPPAMTLQDMKPTENLSPIQPTPPQPMYISSPSVESPYDSPKDSIMASKQSPQNLNLKNPLSMPSNVSVPNKKLTFLATADLSALVKQQAAEIPTSLSETDRKFPFSATSMSTSLKQLSPLPPVNTLTNLHKTLPMNMNLPLSPMDIQPPLAKKGRLDSFHGDKKHVLKSRLQSSGEELPTVVRMYSPVRETPDVIKKPETPQQKLPVDIIKEEKVSPPLSSSSMAKFVSQITPSTVQIGALGNPHINFNTLAHLFQKHVPLTSAAPGTPDFPSSQAATLKERLLSLPANLPGGFLFNAALVPPVQSPVISSPGHMVPPLPHPLPVSVPQNIPHTTGSSTNLGAPPSLPINLPLPLPSTVLPGSQQILTTHPLSGIPIYMPNKDGTPTFVMPAVSQDGKVLPLPSPQQLMSKPHTPTSVPFPYPPDALHTRPDVSRDNATSHSQKPVHSNAPQREVPHQPEPLPLHSSSNLTMAPQKKSTQIVSSRDFILGTKRHQPAIPEKTPRERNLHSTLSHTESEAASAILLLSESVEQQHRKDLHGENQRPSVQVSQIAWPDANKQKDDAYHSLQGIPGPSINVLTTSNPSAIAPHRTSIIQSTGVQFTPTYSSIQSLDSGISSMSLPLKSVSLPSPQILPSVSPSSETDSCDESIHVKPTPTSSEDNKPVSLILHKRDKSYEESVSMEVSKEESFNPINDVIERLSQKIGRIEGMNKEKRFSKKDLSLLMIVYDILTYKKASLRQTEIMEFIITAHKLEASLDISLSQGYVPDFLRSEWRDFTDRHNIIPKVKKIPSQTILNYHVLEPDRSISGILNEDKNDSITSEDSLLDFKEIKSAITEILEKTLKDDGDLPALAKSSSSLEDETDTAIGDLKIKLHSFPQEERKSEVCSQLMNPLRSDTLLMKTAVPCEKKEKEEKVNDERNVVAKKIEEINQFYCNEKTHTSYGFHNYAKTKVPMQVSNKILKRDHQDSQVPSSNISPDETIIRISSGQKCVSLQDNSPDQLSAQINDIKVNLKFAICSEDLAKSFQQLSLTKEDMKDVTLMCFHDPKVSNKSRFNKDDTDTERIIQIVEDLRQSENIMEGETDLQSTIIPTFPMDDVDILVVDKDALDDEDDDLPNISHLENYPESPRSPRNPVMNTEEADLIGACGSSLFPSYNDMTDMHSMMSAIEEELDMNAPDRRGSNTCDSVAPNIQTFAGQVVRHRSDEPTSLYLGGRSTHMPNASNLSQLETQADGSGLGLLPPFSSFVSKNGN